MYVPLLSQLVLEMWEVFCIFAYLTLLKLLQLKEYRVLTLSLGGSEDPSDLVYPPIC